MWRKRLDKLWRAERIKLLCRWNTWFLFNNSPLNSKRSIKTFNSLNLTVSLEHKSPWSMISEPPPLYLQNNHFWVSRKQTKHHKGFVQLQKKRKISRPLRVSYNTPQEKCNLVNGNNVLSSRVPQVRATTKHWSPGKWPLIKPPTDSL